jgi:hypothetical protein
MAAVLDLPFRVAAFDALPAGKILAVEEHDGVRGRWAGIDDGRILLGGLVAGLSAASVADTARTPASARASRGKRRRKG